MLVKYCPKCHGKPYTDNLDIQCCPLCNTTLCIESVDDSAVADRRMLPVSESYNSEPSFDSENLPAEKDASNTHKKAKGYVPVVPVKRNKTMESSSRNNNHYRVRNNTSSEKTICGKVSQYSSTGKEDGAYRRLFVVKIIDAIIYHQRIEDVLHRFNVRVDNGKDDMGYSQFSDIPVNVHGTIATGMPITENSEVEVKGKYRNGVLMASKVNIVNNGCVSEIKFQHSIAAIVYGALALLAAVAVIVFAANSDGNFFASLKSLFAMWLTISAITSVLYFFLFFMKIGFLTRLATGRPRRFPIVGILLFSLFVTMVFLNAFGIGATVGSLFSKLLSTVLPVVLVIVILIIILKLFF